MGPVWGPWGIWGPWGPWGSWLLWLLCHRSAYYAYPPYPLYRFIPIVWTPYPRVDAVRFKLMASGTGVAMAMAMAMGPWAHGPMGHWPMAMAMAGPLLRPGASGSKLNKFRFLLNKKYMS